MFNERRHLTLVLDGDPGDRPTGWLEDEDGTRREFAGWIDLATAITCVFESSQRPPEEPS
jgi:hypothetical protein